MQVKITDYFLKETRAMPKNIQKRIIETIELCEQAESIAEIRNLKALNAKKNKSFFRIRMGDYRIGIQIIDKVITFESVGTRGDFYKSYPPK